MIRIEVGGTVVVLADEGVWETDDPWWQEELASFPVEEATPSDPANTAAAEAFIRRYGGKIVEEKAPDDPDSDDGVTRIY